MSIYKSADSPYKTLTWISTGFHALDKILGGGIATRKISEVSGVFSVGKSTLALQIAAQAQALKMPVLWADSEFSWSEDYSAKLGVDVKEIDLLTGRDAEEILDEIEGWASKHKNALIVLDSVGGLLPRQEAEKGAEGKTIGGQAKLIATFCRKMVPILALNNNALLVLNHQFTDIMSGRLKTSGGAKLEYSKSLWLKLRAANKRVMSGENQVGIIIEAEIGKNKLAPTAKQKCELTMLFGEGFSAEADKVQEMLDSGEITKTGNSYHFRGEKVAVGMAKLREWAKTL